MVRHPVAANLLLIMLFAGGFFAAAHMQKEVFPNFLLDIVEVDVSYPGAAPEEVEQGVLLPVEEAIQGVQGIKTMTSSAREGSANVELELVAGVNTMQVFQEIDQAISRIRTFPDDIDIPEVRLQTQQRDVMELGLYGDVDISTLRILAERLRDRLLAHPAISQAELGNVPDYATHVEISQKRLREYGLTLEEVARIIEASSRDVPAGTVETYHGEILLRMNERKQWSREFAGIPIISSATGTAVTLGDIADVQDGFEEVGFHSQFNEQPSVEIEIFRVGRQSPLEIAEAVEHILEEFRATLPASVHIRIDSNRAEDYGDRLSLLVKNGLIAVVIVLAILALFLEIRLAFWVMMGMAASFVGGLIFLPMIGVSINMVSMFAFLVVLGIVVDDAIVVGENVYEYRQRDMGPVQAAICGARDVAHPVTFSILSNIVAFLPLMFIPGAMGKFWWPLPAVVITVLAISLFEALFILPAHLAHTRQRSSARLAQWMHGRQQRFSSGFSKFVNRYYRAFLSKCLRYRYVTLTAALGLLIVAGGYAYSDHMGMIMMPEVTADEIEAGVRLPVGTTRRQAAEVAAAITASTRRMFEEHDLELVAEGIKTNVRGENFIDVEIVMKLPDEREKEMSTAEVIALWRDNIGDLKGIDQITFEAESGPGGWRDDISVDLSHSDIDLLEAAGQDFLERMKQYTTTRDVNDNFERGKSQLNFTLLPAGHQLGFTPAEVGRQLRSAFYGALAMRQLRGINEVEMRVKLPRLEREDIYYLDTLMLQTPAGGEVPLMDVVDMERTEAFTSINRRNGLRIVTVGMDVEPKRAISQVIEAINREELPRLRQKYPGITWSFQGSQAEMRESTQMLWGGFGLAMAVIYALLAVAFGSYLQPLIVMSAIPFGIVGAVLGHILLGFDLSLISLMGVVALSGVVVNDSLIMIHFANQQRLGGASIMDAIHQAGLRRFRPILLTTLTTFGGLTPIILETSRQAAYLIPMAISLGFGIVFATAIILVIVPCLYLVLEDVKARAGDSGRPDDAG